MNRTKAQKDYLAGIEDEPVTLTSDSSQSLINQPERALFALWRTERAAAEPGAERCGFHAAAGFHANRCLRRGQSPAGRVRLPMPTIMPARRQ